MSIDGKDRSYAAFINDYASGDAAGRIVAEIDVTPGAELGPGEYSPFVVIRYGRWAAVVNPQGLSNYLDIDVHAFVDGEDGAIGAMGMNVGQRVSAFQREDTPLRVDMGGGLEDGKGAPAVRMVALFVGDYEGEEQH